LSTPWRKAAAVMGASPTITGTARGQSQRRQAFVFTNAYALLQPEVLVAHEKFDAQHHRSMNAAVTTGCRTKIERDDDDHGERRRPSQTAEAMPRVKA
jgi:NAD(P)H-dependent FMN reductase